MKHLILSGMMLLVALTLNAQNTITLHSEENTEEKTEEQIWLEIRENVYQSSSIVKNGDSAPNFKTYTLDGKEIQLSDFKGKVVHISFWGTWCGPCLKELKQENLPSVIKPFMENPDYIYLPIAQDHCDKLIQFFESEKGQSYSWMKDITVVDGERDIFHIFATKSIPRNIIIDRDGKVAATSIGSNDYELKLIESTLEKLLN